MSEELLRVYSRKKFFKFRCGMKYIFPKEFHTRERPCPWDSHLLGLS